MKVEVLVSLAAYATVLVGRGEGVDVPGWHREHIPGAERGTDGALFQVFDDVLSPALVDALREEAPHLDSFAHTFGNLAFNKYVTFWRPVGNNVGPPRSASEAAVDIMFDILFGKGGGVGYEGPGKDEDPQVARHRARLRKKVVGGKYWFQYRGQGNGVGFHYDKDEGMASEQMKMRFPMYSTVTYLESRGAPTLILNQTVINNGNLEVPAIPNEAWLVYPKTNKMMVQRGDLNHGADWSLSANPLVDDEKRITFVISWEDIKPLEPNCHFITDEEFPEKVRRNVDPTWSLGENIRRVNPSKISPRHGNSQATVKHISMGRDGSYLHALFPEPRNRQSIPDPLGSYLLQWNQSQVFGQVYNLDLHSSQQNKIMWGRGVPAAIVISDHASHSVAMKAILRAAKKWIGKFGVNSMNFFIADSHKHDALFKEFGIPASSAPTAVIHNTALDIKYVMNRGSKNSKFTARRLLRFFSRVKQNRGLRAAGTRRWEEL